MMTHGHKQHEIDKTLFARQARAPYIFFIVCCLTVARLYGQSIEKDTIKFNHDLWLKNTIGPKVSVRFQMLRDLIDSYNVKTLKKDQVRALLGKPMLFEMIPENEDWYVVLERYHGDGNDPKEMPYLQISLVVKYNKQTSEVLEIGLSREKEVPGKKKIDVVYTKF
jgi:hypothetical protein